MSRKAYSEEERDLIRSRLMDVAAALFKEKGIRDTNIDEIYTPVGISKTFFYSFFPSKAVLAIAIMKEGMGGIGDLFRRNVWEYGAENGIKETFSEGADRISERPRCAVLRHAVHRRGPGIQTGSKGGVQHDDVRSDD